MNQSVARALLAGQDPLMAELQAMRQQQATPRPRPRPLKNGSGADKGRAVPASPAASTPRTPRQLAERFLGVDPSLEKRGYYLPMAKDAQGRGVLAWPRGYLDAAEAMALPFAMRGGHSPTVEDAAKLALGIGTGGMAASSVAGPGKGALGIFVGRKGAEQAAKTDPARYRRHLDNYQRAQDMEAQGVHRDRIWFETGWGRGPDGEWVREIDDTPARKISHGGVSRKLGHVLGHPELYDHYPGLAHLPFEYQNVPNALAAYQPPSPGGEETLLSTNPPPKKSTDRAQVGSLLHEAQHAIQTRENMGAGSNLDSTKYAARAWMRDIDTLGQEGKKDHPQMVREAELSLAIDYADGNISEHDVLAVTGDPARAKDIIDLAGDLFDDYARMADAKRELEHLQVDPKRRLGRKYWNAQNNLDRFEPGRDLAGGPGDFIAEHTNYYNATGEMAAHNVDKRYQDRLDDKLTDAEPNLFGGNSSRAPWHTEPFVERVVPVPIDRDLSWTMTEPERHEIVFNKGKWDRELLAMGVQPKPRPQFPDLSPTQISGPDYSVIETEGMPYPRPSHWPADAAFPPPSTHGSPLVQLNPDDRRRLAEALRLRR